MQLTSCCEMESGVKKKSPKTRIVFFGNFIKLPKESLQSRQRGGSGQCACVCICVRKKRDLMEREEEGVHIK